ncbi:hypothetical protein AB0E59_21995 [Lentzea sp. NPDC034063]|uniref:hypothetical protein n=1 Tax=unclassified Lentzea TaxID=2643253 RepID=UPI0033D60C89
MTMKKTALGFALALAFGLCAAPSALAAGCGEDPGDPVYDPGDTVCTFGMAPAMPGAEASVHGRYFYRYPRVDESSYLKDTADDGLAAYLWVRTVVGGTPTDKWIFRASGAGATTTVTNNWPDADAFYLRVCVGEGTANCSDWRG